MFFPIHSKVGLGEKGTDVKQLIKSIINRFKRKKRTKDLSRDLVHVTKADIIAGLSVMDIDAGAICLVHSSLKSLGFVDGGAQTAVEALMDVFVGKNGGTLMLPTFTIQGTMHKTLKSGAVFDVREKASGLGAIPDSFLQIEGVERSVHPTHSFAALGRDARELLKDHHLCGSSFGPGSPMAKLLVHNAYVIGLGSDLGHVTFYHCLEEIEDDFPLDVFTSDSPLPAQCKDWDGKLVDMSLKAHDGVVSKTRIDGPENHDIRSFYTKWLEERAGLKWYKVGQGKVWAVRADEFYRAIKDLMKIGITIYSTKDDLVRLAHLEE